MTSVLLCEDDFDSIMTGVYDGWVRMNAGEDTVIHVGTEYNYSFMCEYIDVTTDQNKAMKVADSIKRKIGQDAFEAVYKSAMHFDPDRGQAIFDFLKIGYKVGPGVLNHLSEPRVMRIMELSRKVGREGHFFREFIRFTEVRDGNELILFSKINPKVNVLSLIGEHFCDRFPMENWVIYDDNRHRAAIHQKGDSWGVAENIIFEKTFLDEIEQEGQYEKLWKIFHDTIAIENRRNISCQNNMLPKWFRKNMTEFI